MMKTLGLALMVGAVVASDARALHDEDVTDAELRCQAAVSRASVKFFAARGKCAYKCIAGARKTPPLNSETDCFPPFGGATLDCVAHPRRGAEAKAIAAIAKACIEVPAKTDCPECYAARGGAADCSDHGRDVILNGLTNPPTASLAAYAEAFTFGFEFCSDDPNTAAENACEQKFVKAIVKFIGCKYRCYDRCNAAMHRGTIPIGSCNPPAPSDAATFACLFAPTTGCEAKVLAAADRACFAPPADAPECYSFTSSSIVSFLEAWLDGNFPQVYCGSPSGAFLAD